MPSVPGYLQAYLQPGGGGLGTSGGVQYDSYRTPQGTFNPDGTPYNPGGGGGQPSPLTPGGEDQATAQARQASFHEQQRQQYIGQWGSDQGFQQYAPERGSFGQFARGPQRWQARQDARQSYYDQMLGVGPGSQTGQAGGQMTPVNDPTAQNQALAPGGRLMAALQGGQLAPLMQQMAGSMGQMQPGQPGRGGKGGFQNSGLGQQMSQMQPAPGQMQPAPGQMPQGGGGKGGFGAPAPQQAGERMSY